MLRHRSQKHVARARRKRLFWLCVAVLAVGAVVSALWVTHTFPFHKKKQVIPIHTANSTTKGEPLTGNKQSGDNQNSNWPSDNKSPTDNAGDNSTPTSTEKLQITDGNFVSNHRPHMDEAEQSSCITNPGATCQIIFTAADGTIKTLPVQKTDVGGGAYWNRWAPSSIGLTPGTWHVQAKAVLGSQTATANDAVTLEVSQ
jgi:cytoskeletal protein RodZ